MRIFITYAVATIITVAIAVVWGVSAAANWYFGASLGDASVADLIVFKVTTSELFSWASLAVDVLKALMLILFFGAVANRQFWEGLALGAIWVICTFWSFNSAIGFVALNHSTVVDNRGQSATNWAQLEKDIQRLEERREWVPKHRPYETVQAELAGKTTAYMFTLTSGCTNVTFKGSRVFCDDISRLRQEEVSAKAGAELDKQLEERRQEQKGIRKVSSADPWAELVATVIGSTATQASSARATGFAFLVEFISAIGLWAVWSVPTWSRQDRATAAKVPEATETPLRVSPPVAPRSLTVGLPARPDLMRKATTAEIAVVPPDDNPPGDKAPVADNGGEGGGAPAEKVAEQKTIAATASGPRIVINNDTDGHEKDRRIMALERGKKKTNGLGNVKEWLSECTSQTPDKRVKTTSKECHQSYRAWCEIGGWHPVGQQDLARKMSAILGRPTKTKTNAKNGRAPRDGAGRVWPGLMVYSPSATPLRATA